MKTAIVYGSGFTKHTKSMAEYMGKKIEADVFNAKGLTAFDFEQYDTILIGTNVHAGSPNKHVLNFVKSNTEKLSGKKMKLFISCMFANEKGQKQAEKISSQFGINDFAFFTSKDGKNSDGMSVKLDAFISSL